MNANQENFNVTEIKSEKPAEISSQEKKPARGWSALGRRHFKIGLAVIVAIIFIVAITAFLKGWFSFSKDKIELEIIAPQEISSGEEFDFTVRYKNNNRVGITDVRLVLNYPPGAYSVDGKELTKEVIEAEKLLPKKEAVKSFRIRLAGERGNIKYLMAGLSYRPENINSSFENSTSFKISINSVLLGLYLVAPQKTIGGGEVSYILDYINNSDKDFSNLRIELKYPAGFTFKTANPQPIEGNKIWQLEGLKKNEHGTINISGILDGLESENKTLEASIGEINGDKFLRYSQTSAVTQISNSPLVLNVFQNDGTGENNISAGEKLSYRIEFKNNADIVLSQLVLKAYFQGEMFDFRTLRLKEKGLFDSLNNVITWSAAGDPSLALLPPGESGQVEFLVSIKDNFLVNDFTDKNFKISVRAELETLNVPPQFNLERLKIEKISTSKLNSKTVLKAKGYYNETTSNIDNFGPIPPRVNQVTAYTIHWQITNAANDLENVRITAVLPQGTGWRNVYTTLNQNTELEYNERTKQIVWKIDKIPAAVGSLIPAYELVFQITLQPSVTQIGVSPVLIDESHLEAKDTFTGETLESFSPAIATDLPDDLSIGRRGGEVEE